jgi:tRNA pseudouridine32 synthase
VNGKKVGCDFVLAGGNHIAHSTHRHEPPVAGTADIEIVADTDSLLVVNKPSTVPMHPCGGYRFNSLFHIMDR